MSFKKLVPVINLSLLGEEGSCLSINTSIEPSKNAQMILTLGDMKLISSKDMSIKGISDMDEIALANAYAYALRKKYFTDSKPSYIPSKNSIVCTFPLSKDTPIFKSSSDTKDALRETCIHVALLADDINEASVILEPKNFHVDNVVNFLRKSVVEWSEGKVESHLIRMNNYFIKSEAAITREIPDDWDIEVELED